MPRSVLFAPGYACTPEIWDGIRPDRLPDAIPHLVAWPDGTATTAQAADHLLRCIDEARPDVCVGHSMGGVLLLELLATGRLPPRRTVIVDAFITASPPVFFRNHVWNSGPAIEARVQAMLADQRPRFAALKASIGAWQLEDWPRAALETGAFFVYGGRGAADREAVLDHLGWPAELRAAHQNRVTVVPDTSHFPMLERPEAFYEALRAIIEAT